MTDFSLKHQELFDSVRKTMKGSKCMIDTREDGIYIRLAGNKQKGEYFTLEWVKVASITTEN